MEKCKVKLNICGTDYTITSDDTEEYMYSIGEEVDRKIRSTLEKNPRLSSLMAAQLTALNYCDLLYKSSINIENFKKQIDEYLKQIDDLNETLELKNMEIEELNLDLKKYEDNLTNTEQKVESNMEMI